VEKAYVLQLILICQELLFNAQKLKSIKMTTKVAINTHVQLRCFLWLCCSSSSIRLLVTLANL